MAHKDGDLSNTDTDSHADQSDEYDGARCGFLIKNSLLISFLYCCFDCRFPIPQRCQGPIINAAPFLGIHSDCLV